jgi:hypothetical protein
MPLIELIESLIVESHLERGLKESGLFDYEDWRANGAPEASLRDVYATIDEARRIDTPQFTPRLNELEALYAGGAELEPLVGKDRDFRSVIGRQGAVRPRRAPPDLRSSARWH